MLILVSGGAGSGKSAFAEGLAAEGPARRVYLATMQVGDRESGARVERHRAMRAGKGFETVERPLDLAGADLPEGCAVLLEDLSNLTANEFFRPGGAEGAFERVLSGLRHAARRAERLVVVTNELFSDGEAYEASTAAYLDCLARLDRAAAREAEAVYEVVCGIPVRWKGGRP